MLIRIDPRSEQPIYLQIANSIEGHIGSGSPGPGERLPSARSLSASLGINMHTVLRAYAELQSRSLVEMRRGRGGVVVRGRPPVEQLAQRLVVAARESGMGRDEVAALITEAWR